MRNPPQPLVSFLTSVLLQNLNWRSPVSHKFIMCGLHTLRRKIRGGDGSYR